VDPVGALEQVGLIPGGGSQMAFASTTGARVLTAAAQADFDSTVAWLSSHPGHLGNEDLIGLANAVTDRLNADPTSFLNGHAADGSLKILLPAIESALLNGSSGERGTVWDWLKTQPPTQETKWLQDHVLSGAAWNDPMLAMQFAADLPNSPDGDRQLKDLSTSLFNGGVMLNRFDQLISAASDRLRTPLVEAAFNLLRSDDIGDPRVWVGRLNLLPGADLASGAESLGRVWGQQAPAEALAWANSLPQGETQNSAAAAITSAWATKDPRGAADWVNSLPNGSERDKSAGALAQAIAGKFPGQAWDWTLSIGDPLQRSDTASAVIQSVWGQDPALARQWIDSGPFTPDVKLKLQNLLQKRGGGN